MNQLEQAIVERAEAVLRRTKYYRRNEEFEVPPDENFRVSYILTKGSLAEPERVIAIAFSQDEAILYYPLEPDGGPIADWPPVSDYDTVLFDCLGDGFDLTMMTLETRWSVWSELSDWYGRGAETECPEGLRKYLDTCQKDGITKQVLEEKFGYDGMDAMSLRDALEQQPLDEHLGTRATQEIGGL